MATVLIVDDDKFTRTVLETILSQDAAFAAIDVTVVTASDGVRGLEAFKQHRPDAVVLDLLMPKLDGFGLCKGIRELACGRDTELIAISGVYRDSAVAMRLRTEHNAAFFAKPYQLKEMTRFLAEKLGQTTATSPAPAPGMVARASAGELHERPLPAVLLDLLDDKATGRLLVRRGKVSKTIDLLLGHPVHITSSLRDETLGQLLLAGGVLTDAQHRKALERAAESKKRIGEVLIDLGLLTPEQLATHLTAQLRHKLVSTLRWPVGAWRFEPRKQASPAPRGGVVDGLATIIVGLRETANSSKASDPPEYLHALERRALRLNARGLSLLEAIHRHVAPRFSEAWTDGNDTKALLASGVDRSELMTALDLLWLCGGIEAEPAEGSQPTITIEGAAEMSVRDLSEHSQMAQLPQPPERERRGDELYDSLFDEGSVMGPLPTGDAPLQVLEGESDDVPRGTEDGESGVIDVAGMREAEPGSSENREAKNARRKLLREYLRIQGLDHYGVLNVPRDCDSTAISAAVVERRSKFSMDWYSRFELGRDYAKLEQLHAAYDEAFNVLMDPGARRLYERGMSGAAAQADTGRAPPLEAEIAYGVAEELLARGDFKGAIVKLKAALMAAPETSTYLATLGWAKFLRGARSPRAADQAREHLNEALALNPDSPLAHMYKGIIGADLADDDPEARFHLERTLDKSPGRVEALDALEKVWDRAHEFRPLEKTYRRLIYRTAGRDPAMELNLWRRLAELYRTQLDDPPNARIAFESALRLAPGDVSLQAAITDLDSGSTDRYFERSAVLRTHWRRDPSVAGPGVELMRAATQADRPDAAFLAASALVARSLSVPDAERLYRRFRPKFVVRAQRCMNQELWRQLRHVDDSAHLGALFELLAEPVAAEMPLSLEDLEVDETLHVSEAELPEDFVRVRAYVSHLLGVAPPSVYLRSDFGHQIHVGAINPPVLLAGDDAIAAPERSELSFRLGRAMTYLYPGRALGGSRPARFLRAAVLAAWRLSHPSDSNAKADADVDRIHAKLAAQPKQRRDQICELIASIAQQSNSLNLSAWARGLARTADRFGLLLCGDVPAARRFAADSSGGGASELVDFAVSSQHMQLRAALGLSIDV